MKLVILEPIYFSNYHIGKLKNIGYLFTFEDFPMDKSEVLKRLRDAEICITASTKLDEELLSECKSLKMIALACSGYDQINLDVCKELGITVTNVPFYATEAVAEHTFALLLALMKRIRENDRRVREGLRDRKGIRLMQLSGKTFGIIGTGRIGSHVAKIANAFGCRVLANTLHPSEVRGKIISVEYVSLKQLLSNSDIITIHVSLNTSNVELINQKEFSLMKRRPILINTSRGKIINHEALVEALTTGQISGVGLDVLSYENVPKTDPIFKFSNVLFSPHNAYCTQEALDARAEAVVDNIESFVKGYPKNVIDIFSV